MPAIDFTIKRISNKQAVAYDIMIANQIVAQNVPINLAFHLYLKDNSGQVIESTVISVQDKKLDFEEEVLLSEHNNRGC